MTETPSPSFLNTSVRYGGEAGKYVSASDTAKLEPRDLDLLKDLIEAGKLRSVIDRGFPLEEIVRTHEYVEAGHKKGNVVITMPNA